MGIIITQDSITIEYITDDTSSRNLQDGYIVQEVSTNQVDHILTDQTIIEITAIINKAEAHKEEVEDNYNKKCSISVCLRGSVS